MRQYTPSGHGQAGSTLIWLIIWLVGMAAIAYWCVARHVPALQQQITSNAQAAVISANAGDIDVTVDGRTATLAGVVATDVQKEQLLNVVADAGGVRHVNDQLTVAGQNKPDTTSATVQTVQNDTVIVEGAVEGLVEADINTSRTTETIEAKAPPTDIAINEADEQPSVSDTSAESTVEPDSNNVATSETDLGEPSLQIAELVLPSTEEIALTTGTESIDAKALALIEQAKKETASALIDPQTPRPNNNQQQTQASTPQVTAQANASSAELPSLKMQFNKGTLTLTGDISDEDSLLEFIRSAMSTFEASYVVNSVQVNDYTAKADWLPALNRFLPEMRSVSNAGIAIVESQITLSGEAENDSQHDQVIDKALAEFSKLSLVERISVNSQAPSADKINANQSNAVLNSQTPSEDTGTDANSQTQALNVAYETIETDRILFESGSDVLTEESLSVIETIAVLFAEYPLVNIEIDGHTDASGISANNLKLSQLRANAVRDYLVQQGIAAERLSAYGFGDGVPIADNSTAAGRRLNRRIEFNF